MNRYKILFTFTGARKQNISLKKYIKPNGSITSTRMNGNCKLHQRHIANEIKKARFMGLIPFVK